MDRTPETSSSPADAPAAPPGAPADLLAWEDLPIGEPLRFGAHELTEAAIVAFATEWDPQPWHIDPEGAAESIFGEIVACAAHLFAIVSKLMLVNPAPGRLLAGLGNRDLRLVAPGRIGDILSMRLTYTAVRPSQSRPGTGIVDMLVELVDQDDRVVLRNEGSMLVAGRAGSDDDPERGGHPDTGTTSHATTA